MSIIPIPSTRVGDYFVRQRLVGQVQADQLDLFKLQNQVSTGKRMQLPSDDAPAALRAISLQRLLDRKDQISTNIESSSQYLTAAEAQLGGVADILNDVRGGVVGVAGTLSNDSDRQALVDKINEAIKNILAAGNSQTLGRYLFAGSRSQDQPYDYDGQYVTYSGNEGTLRSYVDLQRLFDTNTSGVDALGGISSQVRGGDLDPQLTADTLVSTINDGKGIARNSSIVISVNTGPSTKTSTIDLSSAVTMGDVARLIERGAPSGTEIVADVTGQGLRLSSASGTISVAEVSEGKAASDLGFSAGMTPNSTLTGSPLNPAVLKTTSLDSLLGTRAQGRIVSSSKNNDITITAKNNGVEYNDVRVVFAAGGSAGSEVASYDGGTKTLTVQVESGLSTAKQVAAAISAQTPFNATIDYHDQTDSSAVGSNPVEVTNFGILTSGGGGTNFDRSSGLALTNAGKTVTIDTSGAQTVEDVMNLIIGSGLGLSAEVNAAGNGIDVRSRVSGADFTIGENGGTTATQLGIRTYTGSTKLADFNRGVGVPNSGTLEQLDPSKLDDLRIVARDGTPLQVNLTGVQTLQDIADKINNAAGNNTGTTAVLARLSVDGNRIELVDSSGTPTTSFRVEAISGKQAAQYLGFVPESATQQASTTTDVSGNNLLNSGKVAGTDFKITTADGTALWIDMAGAKTVDDVIKRINENPANGTGPNQKLVAQLATTGNGIELVDQTTGAGTLTVTATEGSQAAEYLGFVAAGQTTSNPASIHSDGAGHQVLTSDDKHTLETDGVFNTLIRLKTALEKNDTEEIGRSLDRLDADISRVSFARSDMGSRLQSLDTIGDKLKDENVQLKQALADDTDVDLVQAISDMTARQYAFQASLQTAANVLNMSLLDFI
jgi:flagellin-like hook-associated protein FlgL